MGLFADKDRNDVMEFAPPEAKMPANRWTKELNFLAWRNQKGEQTAELPAGALLRVTVQWREAHEPDLLRTGEDPYREPLANLGITLALSIRSRRAPSSPTMTWKSRRNRMAPPPRLAKTLNAGVYEQSIVFRVVRPVVMRCASPAALPTTPARPAFRACPPPAAPSS